ncbi:MAG: DegT/DnrJ/EryC1/StrS family aminotransferase [Terriglobales bacterium]
MTNKNEPIPFLDLVTPHRELEQELVSVFRGALNSAGFIGGPMVERFEQDFARFCGTKHCVGVGSGTDALRFALIGAGVEPGDIVVTVPNTFIATTEAISQAGARPDFVDIDERTYNMDPKALAEYLETNCSVDMASGQTIHRKTGRVVRAIIPVHLYGQPADMDPILHLAEKHHVLVVEDACQAHGAEYYSRVDSRWKKAGSMGKAAAFSFYPGKNLGACGEAGAVTTNDELLAKKIRMLRDHGQAQKYYHDVEGYNGRLDAIQAGILRVKLEHLAEWNQQRRQGATRYAELLSRSGDLILPHEPASANPIYHLYVVRANDREALRKHLAEAGIGTGIHYPVPLHLQKAYAQLEFKAGDFPITERVADTILSLPMFPQLTEEQQKRIAESISLFLSMKSTPASENAA